MSSFEEENLYQMDDDFLDSESAPQPLLPVSSQSPFLSDHHSEYYILQEIVESGTNAEVDVLGSVIKHVRKKLVAAGKIIGQKKWLVKNLKKEGYNASLCHTYWPAALNCPGGEYEYIDILCEGRKGCASRVIVDIDFKSQFELARPTSDYKELCDMLPSIFVGDEQKLNKIISILCGEAKNSFRERGLNVPPWRTPCYMHSKWFSPSRREVCAENAAARDHDVVVSFKVIPRRKYLGVDQCGLSSQFPAMSTNCK
ncbi:hypothetical protein Pfo_008176 [Paulownia fortunei]|nr:hypothetical protein Pfo_008176 [Paulownia fortunei]